MDPSAGVRSCAYIFKKLNLLYTPRMEYRQVPRDGMRRVVCAIFSVWLLCNVQIVRAETGAVLVMFDQDDCPYCDRWRAEIGVVYHKTPEGRRAPLRSIDLHAALPSDLPGLRSASYSPVFVLWQNGREIGRIQGYPGEDFFWPMLGDLLAQLDEPA